MSAPHPHTLIDLFRVVRDFAAAHYPGHRTVVLTIELADGTEARIPVPACCASAADDGRDRALASLNEMERNLYQALAEAPGPLPGPEVADKGGYRFTGRVQEALARLVRLKLVRTNGHQGYPIA